MSRKPFAETGTLEELIAPNGWIREILRPTRKGTPAVELANVRLDVVIVLDATTRTAEIYRPFYQGLQNGRWGSAAEFIPTNALLRFQIDTLFLAQPSSRGGTSRTPGAKMIGRGSIDRFACTHYRWPFMGTVDAGETRFWICRDPGSGAQFLWDWRWLYQFGDAGSYFLTEYSQGNLSRALRDHEVASGLFQVPASFKVIYK